MKRRAAWLSLALFVSQPGSAQPAALTSGKEAFRAGDYEQAAKLLGPIRDLAEVCEASFYLGVSRYRLKRLDDAIVSLEESATCPASPSNVHLALGQAYIEKGDDNRAASAMEKALQSDKDNLDALRSLASLYLRHEANDKAIPLLERLVAQQPSDAQGRADLGAAYAGSMQLKEAREQLEVSVKLGGPNQAAALVGLANVNIKAGEPEAGLPLLDRALEIDSQRYEPYFLRGTVHAKAERYKQAVADLLKAVDLGGDNDPEIHYHLSRIYKTLGDADRSKISLERFKLARAKVELRSEAVRQTARLTQEARSLMQLGNLSRAVETLERAAELKIQDAQLYHRLASLYLDLNRLDLALERSRTATGIAPGVAAYRYLLGVIELKLGDLKAAREQLQVAVRLNPRAADAFNALGDLAMREKMYVEAAGYFQQAVKLQPDVAAYLSNLETARRLGRF